MPNTLIGWLVTVILVLLVIVILVVIIAIIRNYIKYKDMLNDFGASMNAIFDKHEKMVGRLHKDQTQEAIKDLKKRYGKNRKD